MNMIVNLYTTSLLKHINTDMIRKFCPSVKLNKKTCYTLKQQDSYTNDQALETIVILDTIQTKPDLVCIETGVNEVSKISRIGGDLESMILGIHSRAKAVVDLAENILETTPCKNVALIKMMPRFDQYTLNKEVAHFLKNSYNTWNEAIKDDISKRHLPIQLISILEEKEIQFYSKEKLYGDRDGIHLSGREAPDILGRKLADELQISLKRSIKSKLDLQRRHNIIQKQLTNAAEKSEISSMQEQSNLQINLKSSVDFPSLDSVQVTQCLEEVIDLKSIRDIGKNDVECYIQVPDIEMVEKLPISANANKSKWKKKTMWTKLCSF